MKILHVVPSFGFGGMEKVICTIVRHTVEQYNHVFLSLDKHKEATKWIREDSIKVVDFNKPCGRSAFFKSLYNTLYNIKPDLLMTYNWGSTDAIWLGRLLGISNIIHNEHGFNIDEIKHTNWKRRIIRYFVYRMASRIVVVSRELERIIQSEYRIRNDKVVFIPNGIDTEYYKQNATERRISRKELGFQQADFIVGFLGRLDPVKNFDFMLSISEYCVRRDNHFRLLIIGDGPERERIENMCQKKNIQNHVILMGQQHDVLPYLRAMDAVLLTSLREQMPMTILEAMSVGLPIVATNVGEIPRIVEDTKEGLIKDLNTSPEDFALSLLTLKDFATRRRMGKAARRKIVTAFPEEVMVQKYRDVIDGADFERLL